MEMLGYNMSYHGSDSAFGTPCDAQTWLVAMRAKYDDVGSPFGRAEWESGSWTLCGIAACKIAEIFSFSDIVVQAVPDLLANVLVQERIEGYPEEEAILTNRPVDE